MISESYDDSLSLRTFGAQLALRFHTNGMYSFNPISARRIMTQTRQVSRRTALVPVSSSSFFRVINSPLCKSRLESFFLCPTESGFAVLLFGHQNPLHPLTPQVILICQSSAVIPGSPVADRLILNLINPPNTGKCMPEGRFNLNMRSSGAKSELS